MTDSTRNKITFWFWTALVVTFVAAVLLLIAVGIFAKIPSFKELEHPDSLLATQVIAENGEPLAIYYIENRTRVGFNELSPHLVAAAIATEDIRFNKHSGIDTKGLFRVMVKTLLMRDSSQGGGSTITQQLAKTLYPRKENVGKLGMVWIKLREWFTAVKLERNYTKDEILVMYLNSIFFGGNAYGIRAASETFFDKQPGDLTIEEAATLVGMVNKPTRYNPAQNPTQALERRNFVIDKMVTYGHITRDEADSVKKIPIRLKYQVRDNNVGAALYLRDRIYRDMSASKPQRKNYTYEATYSRYRFLHPKSS